MGFKGSVESFSLADVFQNLAMNQQTGTLRVYSTTDEKNVFFQAGQVRHLSKGGKINLISPEVFLARGLITKQGLETAVSRQKESGSSIGSCLIDLGQISEEQLDEVTRHQIEEEIYDLFSWDHASFEFTDGTPQSMTSTGQLPPSGPALPISHLIMEAARRVDEWERLRKLVPQYKEIYAMDLAVRKSIEKGEMEMDPIEKRVATLIDSARDVDDLIEDSALFKFEVVNALANFVQSSLIRPATKDELRFAEEDCARQNLPKRRIKVLERILAMGGENTKVRRDLAELLAKEHEVDRACIHFSVLADSETHAGKEDIAVDLYRRILSISPKHVKSHEQLAAIYAKRGKKREAFGHYQELFETFREQNHMREARVAAACALECEPSHADLRTALVELLLADNEKEAASQQLELMGDQAARAKNVKAAAEAYRRAMQYRPGNKQLKKKLADAMLTTEDRRARAKKFWTVVVVLTVLGLTGGSLTLLESSNKTKFAAADAEGRSLEQQASDLEAAKKHDEAKALYGKAIAAYEPTTKLFSPLMHYPEQAKRRISAIADAARHVSENEVLDQESEDRRAKNELDRADKLLNQGEMMLAKEGYEQVLKMNVKNPDTLKSAQAGLANAQSKVAVFEEGKAKLTRPPAAEFQSIEQESSFKRKFWSDYQHFLKPDDVKMPLWVKPNTDGIVVLVDGRNEGAIGQTSPKEQNTFRLSFGPHKLEFRKAGYKSLTLNTSELQSPIVDLKLEREPAIRIDLQREDNSIVLSGQATVDGSTIYVGTENGSLLQVGDQDNPITRRYDLSAPGGTLNKEVVGPVYINKRAGKTDQFIYATRDADVIAVEPNGQKFVEKWRLQVKTQKGQPVQISQQAPPTVVKLKIYGDKPMMVLPSDNRLFLVDCDVGAQVPAPVELKANITSAVTGVEKTSTLIVGCSDGTVYGVDLGKESPREWSSGVRTAMVRGRPVFYEDRLLAGTSEGNLYFFDASKLVDRRPDLVEMEGSLDAEVLITGRYLYVGTAIREGFFCVDLPVRRIHWSKIYPDMGTISLPAAAAGNAVYFCTDNGKLFCVDAEKGFPRWVYQFPADTKFASPPVTVGTRVYSFTKNGVITGFDEPQQGN